MMRLPFAFVLRRFLVSPLSTRRVHNRGVKIPFPSPTSSFLKLTSSRSSGAKTAYCPHPPQSRLESGTKIFFFLFFCSGSFNVPRISLLASHRGRATDRRLRPACPTTTICIRCTPQHFLPLRLNDEQHPSVAIIADDTGRAVTAYELGR